MVSSVSEHEVPSAHATPAAPQAKASGPKRVIVVGASSGIGAALVRELARQGYQVAALARRESFLAELAAACAAEAAAAGGRVIPVVHDVRAEGEVPALLERLARELGGLELFVYAAGVMPKIAPGEYDSQKDLDMLAINFGGCVAWCNEMAKLMGSQRSGTIIGISSIAGARGRKGNPMYGSTKAAMDHYLESLRNRLAERRVHVCTIKPGYVDTVMTQGLKTFWLISADQAARTILSAASRRVNERYVPWRWTLVALALRLIPSFLFRKLNF